jgi:hypothetical protein
MLSAAQALAVGESAVWVYLALERRQERATRVRGRLPRVARGVEHMSADPATQSHLGRINLAHASIS